jgi:hypothetical protein
MTFQPHHSWLKSVGIKRYRGGLFRMGHPPGNYGSCPFRFERKEDAVAFKLMFGGTANV